MTFQTLFILWCAVAGAAVLWRNWLNDHPSWKQVLTQLPAQSGKMLTCGSCFTYWLSLASVVLINPLQGWTPAFRFSISQPIFVPFLFFISWMSVAWGALICRFSYVALQELVAYMVHHWHEEEHHPH